MPTSNDSPAQEAARAFLAETHEHAYAPEDRTLSLIPDSEANPGEPMTARETQIAAYGLAGMMADQVAEDHALGLCEADGTWIVPTSGEE